MKFQCIYILRYPSCAAPNNGDRCYCCIAPHPTSPTPFSLYKRKACSYHLLQKKDKDSIHHHNLLLLLSSHAKFAYQPDGDLVSGWLCVMSIDEEMLHKHDKSTSKSETRLATQNFTMTQSITKTSASILYFLYCCFISLQISGYRFLHRKFWYQ